jgi:hypothetical protein
VISCVFYNCKKDEPQYDTTPRFYFINGGTSGFDQNLILFASEDIDTTNLIISSSFIKSKETIVAIAADDNYRTKYNADNGTSYQAMPTAAYSFNNSVISGTSSIYDTVPVAIKKQLLNGESYLLPIRITSVTNNYKIDTSLSVIYLHVQSNALAGKYISTGTRVLYTGDSSANDTSSMETFTLNKDLVPLSADSSQMDYANLGVNGWKYILGFLADGSLSVLPNDVITKAVLPDSFSITEASFDEITRNIYIKSRYKNLNGDERIVEESLTLQ